MVLKPYCTVPCSFYGNTKNYNVCKACDASDRILLDAFMRREEEKEVDIKQWSDLTSWLMNDKNTKAIERSVSKMVANPSPIKIDTAWEFKPVKEISQEQLNIYKQMLNNVYGARANYVSRRETDNAIYAYAMRDILATRKLYEELNKEENDMNYRMAFEEVRNRMKDPKTAIEKVIFNDPATIVMWADHTKTVVKCQDGDIFDPEKGLAMAVAKKFFGNKGNYRKVFKEWIPEEEVKVERVDVNAIAESFERAGAIASKSLNKVFGGTCETCKYKDVLGYKWPCVKCNHGSKWKAKGE